MKQKYRLEDSRGRTIALLEAASLAEAEAQGKSRFPHRYARAVEDSAQEREIRIQEGFQRLGMSEAAAKVAAHGRTLGRGGDSWL